MVRNAGAELNAGMVVCPACKTQCAAGAKFCNNCGAKLENKCPPVRGGDTAREAASAEHAERRFPRRALRCDKGRRLRMRREKPPGRQKGARLFSMLLAVCLMIAALPLSVSAAGEYVPEIPAGRATKTRCSGIGRRERPPATALNTRRSCCWATMWSVQGSGNRHLFVFHKRRGDAAAGRVHHTGACQMDHDRGRPGTASIWWRTSANGAPGRPRRGRAAEKPNRPMSTAIPKSTTRHSTGRRVPAATKRMRRITASAHGRRMAIQRAAPAPSAATPRQGTPRRRQPPGKPRITGRIPAAKASRN